MRRQDRERLIINEAIRFFAEVGFEGHTRALAERLGITQPLLYRYFPDKDSLIERVFHEVYMRCWRPEWEAEIGDRSKPLHDRLVCFYQDYVCTTYNYEWVRLFTFAALKGTEYSRKYLHRLQQHILEPICAELRAEAELPSPAESPLCQEEIELAWNLHGTVLCLAMRKWIHNQPVPENLDGIIRHAVITFLRGAPQALRQLTPD